MVKAGMEPKNMTFQVLIEHPVTSEATDIMGGTNTKETGASGGQSKKARKEKPGKSVTFKGTQRNYDSSYKQKGTKYYDICKLFKPNVSAYNTHYTLQCKSQKYYKNNYRFAKELWR